MISSPPETSFPSKTLQHTKSEHDQTWLITGCSTGFGRLLAQAALDRGDQVVATARDPTTLSDMAKAFPKTARTTALDVTKAGAAEKAVKLAMDDFGRLNVLANNAGFGFIGAFEEATPDEYRPMFETNIIGLLETTRAALPALRKMDAGGRIVNMSSGAGIKGLQGSKHYYATKFVVEGISEALAQEVAPFGIAVTIVEPGPFRTDFLGRSISLAKKEMPEYAGTAGVFRTFRANNDGKRVGDPDKAVKVILKAVDAETPPQHLPHGAHAYALARMKIAEFTQDIDAWEERWRRRPTTCERADRFESVGDRKRVGVRNSLVSDPFCSVVSGRRCVSMAGWDRKGRREARGQMDPTISVRLRDLPSVSAVLNTPVAAALLERYGQNASTNAIRATIELARATLQGGEFIVPTAERLAIESRARLEREDRSGSRPLFNLSGTVLHTNLGRAVVAAAAVEAAVAAMQNPVALEFDLKTGKRGERDDHVRGLLCELTGADDATVVNNNAAAVLLVLNTLANGREAIVSRGELIEIGGAFRMPEIMASAGARLVEVGTTNRTHEKDYRSALNERTGLILKVHTSNYRIQGFAAEVGTADLSPIAKAAGVPLAHDLGSGTLVDLARYGLQAEPTVRQVAAAADLVTFSGDKLLGGPQAGFIVGRRDLIQAINRNPMKRALRVDKIRLVAIEATLKLYRDPIRLAERLPTLRMLTRSRDQIEAQARRMLPLVAEALGNDFAVEICECRSQIGSGALPLETIASAGLAIASKRKGRELERLSALLRELPRPVIGRIEKDRLVLDMRCAGEEEAFLSNLSHFNLIPEHPRCGAPPDEPPATGAGP